jgi:integrase
MRRWKRLGQRFRIEWNGTAVKDVDKAFRRTAHDCKMPDVTPHTLRHTAATWLMQGGGDIWQSAKFLGMTVEQLERTYGHHHPDHLKNARDTLDRRPGNDQKAKSLKVIARK